jgi:hypothetical protein
MIRALQWLSRVRCCAADVWMSPALAAVASLVAGLALVYAGDHHG